MKLRDLALAAALVLPLSVQFATGQATKKEEAKPKDAQDPVCGMMVQIADSPKSEYKGKTYYFCSLEDQKAFDKAPTTYLKVEKKDTTKK